LSDGIYLYTSGRNATLVRRNGDDLGNQEIEALVPTTDPNKFESQALKLFGYMQVALIFGRIDFLLGPENLKVVR